MLLKPTTIIKVGSSKMRVEMTTYLFDNINNLLVPRPLGKTEIYGIDKQTAAEYLIDEDFVSAVISKEFAEALSYDLGISVEQSLGIFKPQKGDRIVYAVIPVTPENDRLLNPNYTLIGSKIYYCYFFYKKK